MSNDHPHDVRQSISDWELEHRECLGTALEKGVKNLIEADEFLRDHMKYVDYGYLKELWRGREVDDQFDRQVSG